MKEIIAYEMIYPKLKQKWLIITKNMPSSSDEKFYTDYFIWQVVYEVTCHVYIVSMRINRR